MNATGGTKAHPAPPDCRGVGPTSPALGRVGALLARLRRLDRESQETEAALREAVELARQDPRTGLPDRRFIQQRLAPALSDPLPGPARIGLMFVDLDAPGRHDHAAGEDDEHLLLQAVARRIRACTRTGDTVCRSGRGEFLVLLRDAGEQAGMRAAADNLRRQLAAPYSLDGRVRHIGTRVAPAIDEAAVARDEDDHATAPARQRMVWRPVG